MFDSLRDLRNRDYDDSGFPRLSRATGMLVGVFVIGTIGYWAMAPARYGLLDCAFMTTITLTTVGYQETIPIAGDAGLQAFTIGLITVGMGIVLYFVSTLTAFIIEGELRDLIRMRAMEREVNTLHDHLIICGIGQTGLYVLQEVLQSDQKCVVIEHSQERIQREVDQLGTEFLYIVGDATDDDVLKMAGIQRATAMIASLGNDRDNLFVTITARSLNDDLRIVARGEHPDAEQKFKMAGATSVIYTNILGGLRMAAEAIRPEVTTFLDLMMRDHEHYRRVEELPLPDHSPLIGRAIRDTNIRKHTDALVIAVYERGEDNYVFNPGPDYVLASGAKLIVMTLIDDIDTLEAIIDGALG